MTVFDYTKSKNTQQGFPQTGLTNQVLAVQLSNLVWEYPTLVLDKSPSVGNNLTLTKIVSGGDIKFSAQNIKLGTLILPQNSGIKSQILSTNGNKTLVWSSNEQGILSISKDSSPSLGGNLNTNGYEIIGDSINLSSMVYNNQIYPKSDGTAGYNLMTDGAGNLSWNNNIKSFNQDTLPTLSANLNTGKYVITGQSINFAAPTTINGSLFNNDGVANSALTWDSSNNLSWLPLSILLQNDPIPTLSSDLNLNGKALQDETEVIFTPTDSIYLKSSVNLDNGYFTNPGDARSGYYILRNVTNSTANSELFLDGIGQRLVVPPRTSWAFNIKIVARDINSDASEAFNFYGLIENNNTQNNTPNPSLINLLGLTQTFSSNGAWTANVIANGTYDSLSIQVNGDPVKTIRWVAFVETTEVSGSDANLNNGVLSVAGKTGNVTLSVSDITNFGIIASQNTISWNQITNSPTIPLAISQLTNNSLFETLTSLSPIAYNNSYQLLTNLPVIPTNISQLINDVGFLTNNAVTSIAGRTGDVTLSVSDITGLIIPTKISQLTNDVGFLTNNAVTSVAGRTGDITLSVSDITNLVIPTKVSQLANDAGYLTSNLVTSVAGRTGDITLSTTDISNIGTIATKNIVNWNTDFINQPIIPTKNSQLFNNSGYVYAIENIVNSIDGRTGNITLTVSDINGLNVPTNISQLTNNSGFITANLVTSVAGRTGAIVLTTSDINGLGNIAEKNTVNWNTDIINEPTIPTNISQLTNNINLSTTVVTSIDGRNGAITLSVSDISGLSIPTKISQLTNNSGYLTVAPVTSVAGKTGVVTLTPTDVGVGVIGTLNSINWNTTEITNKPTVPTNTSQLINDSGYLTTANSTQLQYSLAQVVRKPSSLGQAFSSSYNSFELMDGRQLALSNLPNNGESLFSLIPGAFTSTANATSETLPTPAAWSDIIWTGSLFCIVSNNSSNVAISLNGSHWLASTMPVSTSNSVAWNGSIFCAVGNNTLVTTSPDGVNWTTGTISTTIATWNNIIWNGSIFCAISNSSYAATSPDGTNWTSHSVVSSQNWLSNAWNGSIFCAVSNSYIMTSPNGTSWSQQSISLSGLQSIAWNGSVFCIAANNSSIVATSPNGTSWSTNTIPVSDNWVDIAWNGSLFAILATNSTNVALSPDGTFWEIITLPTNTVWNSIAGGSEDFYIVSTGFTGILLNPTMTLNLTPFSDVPTGWGDYLVVGNVPIITTTPTPTVPPTTSAPQAPVYSISATLPKGYTGSTYSETLTGNDPQGGPIDYTVDINSSLPAGLTLSVDGVLSGTPARGTYTFTIDLNSLYGSTSQTFTLTIAKSSPPTWNTAQTLPNGTIGNSYNVTVQATDPQGASVSYSLESGSVLPTNLTISSGGVISGTITATAGTYYFTINATSTYGTTSQQFNLTIS